MLGMSSLPWIILWGWTLGIGALVLLSALGFITGRLKCRSIVRGRRRDNDLIGEKSESLDGKEDGDPVVLRGTLGARTSPITAFDDGHDALLTNIATLESSTENIGAAASELSLDVEGTTVLLQGPFTVELGARELATLTSLRHLPLAIRQRIVRTISDDLGKPRPRSRWGSTELHDHLQSRKLIISSLFAGDTVVASGVLRRTAGRDETYRKPASQIVLGPNPRERADPRVVLTYAGTPAATGSARLAIIVRTIVAFVLGLALLYGLGEWTDEAAREEYRDALVTRRFGRECYEDPQLPWAVLGATLPFHRREALDRLAYAGTKACTLDREAVDATAALYLVADRCAFAAEVYLDHGEPTKAEDTARRCSDPLIGKTFFSLGFFDEADRALHPVALELIESDVYALEMLLQSQIVTKQWAAAGRTSARLTDYNRDVSAELTERLLTLGCVTDALEGRDDSKAITRLRGKALAGGDTLCGALLTDAVQRNERLAVLDELSENRDAQWRLANRPREEMLLTAEELIRALTGSSGRVASSMGVEADVPRAVSMIPLDAPPLLIDSSNLFRYHRPLFTGLERELLDVLEQQPSLSKRGILARAELRIEAAALALITADFDEAEALFEQATEDLRSLGDEEVDVAQRQVENSRRRVGIGIAIMTHDLDRARTLTAEHSSNLARSGRVVEAVLDFLESGEVSEDWLGSNAVRAELAEQGFRAAASGDGRRLIPILNDADFFARRNLLLWSLRLEQGREPLSELVRARRALLAPTPTIRSTLLHHSQDLLLARALGDDDWASELEPIVERHRAALQQRETAVVLRALGSL